MVCCKKGQRCSHFKHPEKNVMLSLYTRCGSWLSTWLCSLAIVFGSFFFLFWFLLSSSTAIWYLCLCLTSFEHYKIPYNMEYIYFNHQNHRIQLGAYIPLPAIATLVIKRWYKQQQKQYFVKSNVCFYILLT